MPIQKINVRGQELDVDWDTLSPDEKTKLRRMVAEDPNTHFEAPKLPGPKQANMQEVATPNSVFDKAMRDVPLMGLPGFIAKGMGRDDVNETMSKHALGSVMPGGPVLKGLSTLLGVNDVGQLGTNLAGGPIAKYGAAGINKLPHGKTLASMLLGGAQHEVNTGIHNAANPATPQSSLLQGDGKNSTALAQAASILLPGAAAGIQAGIKGTPTTKAKALIEKIRGTRTDPNKLNQLPVADGIDPVRKDVVAEVDRRVAAEQAPLLGLQERKNAAAKTIKDIDVELTTNKNLIGQAEEERSRIFAQIDDKISEKKASLQLLKKDLESGKYNRLGPETDRLEPQILTLDSEIMGLGSQKRALGANSSKIPATEVDSSRYNPMAVRSLTNTVRTASARKQAVEAEKVGLSADFDAMQQALKENPQVPATLRTFQSAKNPAEFLDHIRKSSSDQVEELYDIVPDNRKETFRKNIIDDFAKLAFLNGKPNPQAVSEFYPPEKLAKLYGGGQAGVEAAEKFKNTTEALSSLSNSGGWAGKLANQMQYRVSYATAGYLMFHSISAGNLALGGAAVTALSIPLLLEAAVKHPKFGDQLIEAASSGALLKGSLESFPLVRKYLIENNEIENKSEGKVKGLVKSVQERKTPE
jgi:hypothetical protein